MTHFDEMTCLLYLEGQLERPRTLELEAHAGECAKCRVLLRALERESRLLAQALVEEDESVPARLLAPPARERVPWAWIMSFGLAAAGAYTFWTGIVEPWRQQLNQAGFGEGGLLTILFFRGAFWKGWGDMANTIQLLALIALGIVAVGLLRRHWRRWTTIAVVMGVVAAALALPPEAGAAEVKKAQTFVLSKDQVVKNDLIVTGETIRIDGTVEGDLIVFGKEAEVNGHVTGDFIGLAKFAELDGTVDGNLRIFANRLLVRGSVGKNVSAFAEHIDFKDRSQVSGGMMLFAADTNLEGRLGRDLMGFIRTVMVNGYIGGNAQLRSYRLSIGPSAEIVGKASYTGDHSPEVSPQAKLASPLEVKIVKRRPQYASPRFYWRQLLRYGGAFVFGLVLVLLAPGFFAEVVRSSERVGVSLGLGAVALVTGLILLVVGIVLLIIGVPVGLVATFLFLPAIYAAQTFVGAWLGEKLLGPSMGTEATLGRLALGLLIIRVLGLIPYLGGFVWLAVILWGVGALVLALYTRARPARAVAYPGAAPSA